MSKPKATIKILPVYLPTEDEVARLGANSDTNNNNNNKKKKKNRTTFEKLAEVEAAAFYEADPELSEMLFGPPSEAGRTHRAEELMTQLRENKTLKIFKAVVVPSSSSLSSSLRDTTEESSGDGQKSEEEEEEEIVAFTVWQFHDEPQPVEEWFDKDWPMSPCPQACNDFFGAFSKARNRFMGGKKHAHLEVLVTLPAYQGQGIGKRLLLDGLLEAERRGLDAWLTASAAGYRLYRSVGYEDVVDIHTDLTKYGSKRFIKHVGMLRPLPR